MRDDETKEEGEHQRRRGEGWRHAGGVLERYEKTNMTLLLG